MKTLSVILFLCSGLFAGERYVLDTVIVEGARSVLRPDTLFPAPLHDSLSPDEADSRFRVFRVAYEWEAVMPCGFVLEKRADAAGRRLSLRITVCEGAFVRLLEFSGNARVPAETLSAAMSLREGACFSDDSLERDVARLKRLYGARAIAADVRARVLGAREKRLFFSIEENPAGLAVRVTGNRALTEARIREICRVSGDNRADVRLLREQGLPELRRAYHRDGFFNCRLDLRAGADTAVLSVSEGKRARITGAALSGNSRFPADTLLFHAGFRKGVFYSHEAVKALMASLLAYYGDRGFPFCEISLKPPSCATDSVVLEMAVSENGRFTFGSFSPHGNTVTRTAAVARLAAFREGAPFSESELRRMEQRLSRSGQFERADPLFITAREGRRVLDVHARVIEAPHNRMEGVLGYNPEEEGHPLSGFFNLSLGDIAGTCRQLHVDYLKEHPLTKGAVRYVEPWLLDSRAEGEASANFRMEDPDFTLWEAQGRVNVPVSDHVKLYTGLLRSAHSYVRGDSLAPVTEDVTSTLAGAAADFRDLPENPRRGWSADLPVYYRYKEGSARTYDEIKLRLETEIYLPLRGPHVLALSGAYQGLFSQDDSLTRGELFPLGGSTTIRGYREGRFRGASVIFGRMEYRFLTGPHSRLALFFDAGGFDSRPLFQGFHFPEDVLFGYGGGLALLSRAGLIGVDYGLSRGDTFADGKIHLRLRNDF